MTNIKRSTIAKLAAIFECDPTWLMDLDDGEEQHSEGYYINPETAKVAQEILDNKELSMLFDVSRDISPEDLKVVYQMVLALKRKEQGD